jgi:hypothetical protein
LTTSNHFANWRRAVCLAVLAATAGCGDDSTGVTVEGSVTFQDKPIESGTLTFFATQGAPVTAVINGGAYSCQLEPGEYRAVVAVGVTLPPAMRATLRRHSR